MRIGGRHQTFYKIPSKLSKKLLGQENKEKTNNYNQQILKNTYNRVLDIENYLNRNYSLEINKNTILEKEIKNIEKDLNLIKNSGIKDDTQIINYIKQKEKSLNASDIKEGFTELICYILTKKLKSEIENEIIKYYLLSLENLVLLFIPLGININDIMSKLARLIQFEKKTKDNILWKSGDNIDKLYIIIKGNLGILKQKEKEGQCTYLEYLQYLIILYLYQEKSLFSKIISINNEKIKITKNSFLALLTFFKFYKIYIYSEHFKKKYKTIINFIEKEIILNDYIFKLFNYNYKDILKIFDFDDKEDNIKYLYDFYIYITNKINKDFFLDSKLSINTFDEDIFNKKKISNKIKILSDLYSKRRSQYQKNI